ncbi:toxin-antitoxin system YwqK family antitoxin [Algoriphagus aquimarinus]|uniref:Antitoxin component YwqK of the YwqJK toxin-antitoxin module n=1 Tax=Algoriphagus aquimarinus TaxID=237018 RepID=A0A1I1AG81_9BACT|nr:toxin-antitoxin system YwqK family antitoxin [Algoriphagus aquimarinus]SFB37011.1 Antitoxin component YwqK of the YwqJK toxin-antitoxin module [Algoriphagus aquimarinus]
MNKILLLTAFSFLANFAMAQDTIRTFHDEEETLIKELYFMVNGKANGEIKRFDEEGNLVQIGQLINDQRNGDFIDLDAISGDTVRIIPFVNNSRSGISKSFYPGGTLKQTSTYMNNQIVGEVITYFKSGQISDKTNFQHNKPNGLSETFYESGKQASKVHFSEGRYDGLFEEFAENGQLLISATYLNGVLDGRETQYYEDGQVLSVIDYSKGILDGIYELNYPDGSPERRGNYKKGFEEGALLSYHQNGELRERAIFKKGIPTQPTEKYYASTKLQQKKTFDKQGSPVLEINYFENGQVHFAINYLYNEAQGDVRIYREDGTLEEIRRFKDGKMTGKREFFDEKETLIITEFYEKGNKINK